jgi:hypothetical protein
MLIPSKRYLTIGDCQQLSNIISGTFELDGINQYPANNEYIVGRELTFKGKVKKVNFFTA